MLLGAAWLLVLPWVNAVAMAAEGSEACMLHDAGCLLQAKAVATVAKNHEIRFADDYVNIQSRTQGTAQAGTVRNALQHLWQGYKAGAWANDEVRPISGGPGAHFGNIGMAIIEWMDTLWLAGMQSEFAEGEKWIASLDLEPTSHSNVYETTSFFEVTIRGLGGLLSAYALSGHQVLLDKARALGSKLVQALPGKGHGSPHAWPLQAINLRDPSHFQVAPEWGQGNIVADAGSNILEFTYLSEAAGDPSYKASADANENQMVSLASRRHRHLLGQFLNSDAHEIVESRNSVGALADSYYEYLLKQYLQSGRQETRLLHEWKAAMAQMRKDLVRKTPGGLTFVANGMGSDQMEHLACFMGGLLALGSHLVPEEEKEDWWLPTGIEITRTCYEMYHQSPSGLSGELMHMGETLSPVDSRYLLRPEALESLFYLHRITGNNTYRDWANEMFEAINKHTRTQYGFAAVHDVTRVPPPLDDSEETFLGAETFKYALLVNLPASVLPLDRFVFNTEAHPFPIVDGSSDVLKVEALP